MNSVVREIVKKRCNLPDGFEPTHLSCFCGLKMNLAGADDTKVTEWFEEHDPHYEEATSKWPTRKK